MVSTGMSSETARVCDFSPIVLLILAILTLCPRLASDSAAVKGVGTRHRAALGLAQDSDAVVIVVSEQTGHISLACDGKMSRNLSSVELRRRLIELLSVHKNDSRKEGKKGPK